MTDISKGFSLDEMQMLTGNNKLREYEEALMRIEQFGHSNGHGHGYTCANIAEEVLRKHIWKPEATKEQYNLDAFSGYGIL
jgi:hypothetical protein